MVTKDCLFCGKNVEKKKYVCEECENKIKKLKQMHNKANKGSVCIERHSGKSENTDCQR